MDRDQPESCRNGLRIAETERKLVTGADDARKSISQPFAFRQVGMQIQREGRNPDENAGNSTDRKVSKI
jgi:hypothetical protein